MPDVLHFDKARALDRATEVFWRKGYNSTTIKDLTRATGLSESSLYNTFGGKEKLFLAALDQYAKDILAHLDALRGPGPALEAIRESWRWMCRDAATRNRGKGCLVTNSVVELAPHSKRVRARLAAIYQGFEDLFDEALRRAQAEGELPRKENTRALARYLLHSTQGVRVLSKLTPSEEYLDQIADVAMRAISGGK